MEEIQSLEADIAELEENIKAKASAKATALARMQARIFLERIFAPYIDGVCLAWGVSPEEALRILIKEEATFGKIAADNPAELKELLNHPPIKALLDIASPLKDVTNDWVNEKMGILFEVMANLRPSLAKIIVDTPGGREWFADSLTGLKDILYGKPKLNIEPPLVNGENVGGTKHV